MLKRFTNSCFYLCFFIVLFSCGAAMADNSAPIYSRESVGVFYREWLICGPFTNAPNVNLIDFRHDERCKGFLNDLLAEYGGEAQIDPLPGDKVSVAIGGERIEKEWFLYQAKEDLIHLNELLSPNDNVVAYAFCAIDSPKDRKVMAAIGSNDVVKCWLNGELVHQFNIPMGRWLQKDDDYVPIQLKKGRNRLLLKIGEGSGDFGLAFRLLDYDSTVQNIRKNIEAHKTLSAVSKEDVLEITFGTPHRLEAISPNTPVRFSLIHETNGKVADFEGREGFVSRYPLEGIPDGILTVRASFSLPDEDVVSEVKHYKGRLPRLGLPQRLPNDLALCDANGKAYFPIGTYGAGVQDYEYLRSVGYTFVMGGESSLDAAQKAGLGVGLSLHGSGGDWLKHIRETVRKNREHPALVFWMLFDEPGYNKANLIQMYEAYKLIHEEDPIHPVYLVITDPSVYDTFGRCCDVLAVDTYPVSQGRMDSVGENVQKAYAMSDGDVTVWHCGQMFDWPGDRMPTVQEHRFMTYSSIVSGAKAMLWFTWRWKGKTVKEQSPELWDAHVRMLKELKELEPVLIYPGLGERLGTGHHAIRAIAKRGPDDSLTVFAVNTSTTENARARIQCPTLQTGDISVQFEDRSVKMNSGAIEDDFEPLGVHVYRAQSPVR